MKKLLLLAAFFVSLAVPSYASIIPSEASVIIRTAEVEVSIMNTEQRKFFQVAKFTKATNSLDFITVGKIKSIQIFDAKGNLKYMVPVLSRKVRISKTLFNSGSYQLGFVMDGYKIVEYTNLKIK